MRGNTGWRTWTIAAGVFALAAWGAVRAGAEEKNAAAAVWLPMVDPAIDDVGPFSYLAKPSSQIAVPRVTKGTQLTFDGALNNGEAELCFFQGDSLKPIFARTRTMLEGWLPVYVSEWRDGSFAFRMEVFGSLLQEGSPKNVVNFVRIHVKNEGATPAKTQFAAALRYTGFDHRFSFKRKIPMPTAWVYEMTDDAVIRDGKLIYTFPAGARKEAVPGTPYSKSFTGDEMKVTARAESCLTIYSLELAEGEAKNLDFKMPAIPVAVSETPFVGAIREADFDAHRGRWIRYWRDRFASGARISIPEEKVMNAWRAQLVHCFEAIWSTDSGQWVQGVNKFQYNWFWIRDGALILRSYELLGHNDLAAKLIPHFLSFQKESGNFESQEGQLDGFGQALTTLGQHYVLTGDVEFAKQIYPAVPKAIAWLHKARAEDEFHLMPSTTVRDNEFISGRYVGHNFWALLGLRHAIGLAKATGHDTDAAEFQKEYDDFHAALFKRLDAVCGKDGYIPPGFDVEGGEDWGNLQGVYPAEVLDPFDPRMTTTLQKMHKDKYAEGVMTYMGKIHQYVTTNVTETHLARGEQEQALVGLYHLLLHNDSTNAGFEWTAVPWGDRDVGGNFPPHGLCAAKINTLIRNMLVVERGGNGGVEGRELHFFSAVSPAWAIPGKEVSIRNVPTECGVVSAALRFREDGADFTLEPRYRATPIRLILHVPFFVDLESFKTDAKESRLAAGGIELSPDATHVTLQWTRKHGAPLSFESVLDQYKQEYRRRYEEYCAAGNKPLPVEPPAMLTAEERAAEYGTVADLRDKGIAVGKPVTTNGPAEEGHSPALAVDGDAQNLGESSWWCGPPTPRWLQIDLEKPVRIDRIHVFPYWDYSRHYRYTVEVSRDGSEWTQVADRSRNTQPAMPRGDPIRFDPIEARYVRVTMLFNSANSSVHLVEVRVFAAEPKK